MPLGHDINFFYPNPMLHLMPLGHDIKLMWKVKESRKGIEAFIVISTNKEKQSKGERELSNSLNNLVHRLPNSPSHALHIEFTVKNV